MALAPSARRVLAAVTATALLTGGLSLVAGAASAAALARVSETPAAGSLVGPPAVISATYNDLLSPASTITVTRDGVPVCSDTGPDAADQRTISCAPVRPQMTGTYNVSVNAIDTAQPVPGSLQDAYSFQVDATAPAGPAPTIAPDPVNAGNQSSVTVSGSTDAGATVTVTIDDTDDATAAPSRTTNAAANGTYSVSFSEVPTLRDGTLTASATAADGVGNTSTGSDTVRKDATIPSLTSTTPANGSAVKEAASVSATFSENLASATLVLKDGDGNVVNGQQSTTGGTVTFTPTAGKLPDGVYAATVEVTDTAGNPGSGAFSFTVDSAAPAAPSVQVPPLFNGDLPATGTGEPGAVVTLSVVRAGPLPVPVGSATATVGMDSTYSVTVDIQSQAPDGDYSVTATQKDRAGNVSPASAAKPTTKDSTAPKTPSVVIEPDPIGAATQHDVTVSGMADPGSRVELVVTDAGGSTTVTAGPIVAGSDGTYRFTGVDVTPLADGTLTFRVTAADAAGNSADGNKTATKDTAAPGVTALAVLDDPVSQDNQNDVDVTGQTQPGSTVLVRLTDDLGVSETRTVTLALDDSSFEVTFDATRLDDGRLDATASATDRAGNSGPVSVAVSVTKDATPPAAPTQEQGDVNAANQTAYAVFGVTESGATVTVKITDSAPDPATPSLVYNLVAGPDGRYTTGLTDVRSQRDGTLTITVTAFDAAGNDSVTPQPRAKDTGKPEQPTVTINQNPVVRQGATVPATVSGEVAMADRPMAAGLTVLISVTDGTTEVEGTATPGPTGAYSVTLDVATLADGPITATALVRDAVGNEGPPAPPANAEKNTITLQRVSTTPADGATVRTAPRVSATYTERLNVTQGASPKSTVVVRSRSNTQVAGTTSFSNDEKTIIFTPSGQLTDAGSPYTATFAVQDRIGESSTSSIRFTVSGTAPPTVGATNPINSQNADAVRVFGSTEPSATLTVTIDDEDAGTQALTFEATAGPDGRYALEGLDVTSLSDGTLTVTATAHFTDGVLSRPGTASVIKDTEAPVLRSSSPTAGDRVQPPQDVRATFDEAIGLGATATVTMSGAQPVPGEISYADNDRTVVFTPDSRLADGAYTAAFIVRDVYGNSVTRSFGFQVDGAAPAAPVVVVPETVNAGQAGAYTVRISEVEPGATVTVTISDGATSASRDVKVGDGGRTEVVFDVRQFLDGTLTATARALDGSGNGGPAGSDTSVKDTAAPGAPTVDLPPTISRDDAGAVSVRGTAEPGATVTVVISDGVDVVPVDFTASGIGEYGGVADVRGLADGQITAVATAVDGAGNSSQPSATDRSTKDTQGPSAPSVTLVDPVNSANAAAATVSGSAADASTVTLQVSVDDADTSTSPVTATATRRSSDGSYSAELDLSKLRDGDLTATVTPVDNLGNTGASAGDTAGKDTSAPAFIRSAPAAGSSETPPSELRFVFTEPLGATATVTVSTGGQPVDGRTEVDGNDVVFTPTAALAPGTYEGTADVTDRSGNSGRGNTAFTVRAAEPAASPSPTSEASSPAATQTPTQPAGGGGGGGGGGDAPAPSASPSPSGAPSASPSASVSPSPSASVSPSSGTVTRNGAGFIALTSPTRVLDSRDGTGTDRGVKRERVVLDLSSRIPAGAKAAVLNLTVTNPSANGFVVVYPDGNTKPGTSNVNFVRSQTQANEVVVGLPASRRVVVFVDSASAHVIADLVGFFTEASSADLGRVVTQAPTRVLDSRDGTGTPQGRKQGEVVLDLSDRIPAGTTAVALNVTVAGPSARGYVVAYPTGTTRPGTSNVNFERGQTQANEVVTRLGTGANAGKVSLFVDSASAALIADLVATVVPRDDNGAQLFTALEQPRRVMDTREGLGTSTGRKNGDVLLTLPTSAVPAGATGVVLNVTTTGASRTGFVAVYPTGTTNPGTSNVNFRPGVNQANEVLTAISSRRQVTLSVGGSGTPLTHVIVDVVGYLTDSS